MILLNILEHYPFYSSRFIYLRSEMNMNRIFSHSVHIGTILEMMKVGREVQFLPTTKGKAHELIQHLWNVNKAFLEKGKIYCPSRKGSTHDGCYLDLRTKQVSEVIQLKTKNLTPKFGPKYIDICLDKYSHLDELQFAFNRTEDLISAMGIIEKGNQLASASNLKLRFQPVDIEVFLSYPKSHFEILKDFQWQFNAEVTFVNNHFINKLGEIRHVDEQLVSNVFEKLPDTVLNLSI